MKGKLNILIVDDNKGFVEGLEMLLINFHADKIKSISKAYNGKECLDQFVSKKFNLVFMDYSMPGLNGAETTKVLSQNHRFLRIIALTFHKEEKVVESMIYSGAYDYITKDELNNEVLGKYLKETIDDLMLN